MTISRQGRLEFFALVTGGTMKHENSPGAVENPAGAFRKLSRFHR